MSTQTTMTKVWGFFLGGIVLGSIVTTGFFLSQKKKQAVDISALSGVPLMQVDGQTYATSQLPDDATMEYYLLESNIYNAKKSFVQQVGMRLALAKDAQKLNEKPIPKLAQLMPLPTISDNDVRQYYEQVRSRMGAQVFGGQSFEQVREALKARMGQQRAQEVLASKAQELEAAGRLRVLLPEPQAPAVQLDVTSYPSRGNPSGTNVLVEVADYMCPHCRETQPAVENLYKDYKDKVKFVHVSFPLAEAGLSGALARGAFCAQKQGNDQFWAYHALAFQVPWDKNQAPAKEDPARYFDEIARGVAVQAGLNDQNFQSCLQSTEAREALRRIQETFTESKGFQGTPAFYWNGRLLQASPEQLESTVRAALR